VCAVASNLKVALVNSPGPLCCRAWHYKRPRRLAAHQTSLLLYSDSRRAWPCLKTLAWTSPNLWPGRKIPLRHPNVAQRQSRCYSDAHDVQPFFVPSQWTRCVMPHGPVAHTSHCPARHARDVRARPVPHSTIVWPNTPLPTPKPNMPSITLRGTYTTCTPTTAWQ